MENWSNANPIDSLPSKGINQTIISEMPRIFILIAAKSTACQTEDELFLCQGLQLVYQVAGEGPGVLLADGVQ